MAQKIYLLGGGYQEVVYPKLDKKIIEESKNKIIFIINWTRSDPERIKNEKERYTNYFKDIGFEMINFSSDCNSIDYIKNKMSEAGVLYICGGETKLLLQTIQEKKIEELIQSFEGIIEGNSAGACVCCKKYYDGEHTKKFVKGIGVANVSCNVHYDSPHYGRNIDEQLLDASKEDEIYGIKEAAAIIIENDQLSFIGEVYLFKEGKKEKVN